MASDIPNGKLNSLASIIIEKAKKIDIITKNAAEQVSIDSNSFKMYSMLPDFDNIYKKDYIDSLFLLRNLVGKDILISDLKTLAESRQNGTLESYLEGILKENGNCAVQNRYNDSIDYFLYVRNEINKFYISNERITFFSGSIFYFEKGSRKFYNYSKINEKEAKLGELILKNISEGEIQLRLKTLYTKG